MLERDYQRRLIKRIRERLPGCVVLKNDPDFLQGIPDLIVLLGDQWAMLEVKASGASAVRPNQAFWVEQFGEMSYAAFIYPEIEEDVLNELQQSFQLRGNARVPKRK